MDNILSEFLQFESDEGLFARKYRGVSYWQCIRHDVGKKYIRLQTKVTIGDQIQRKENYFGKITSLLKESLCDFKKGMLLKNCDLLYFDQQEIRYIDGKQVDPYFDFWEFHKQFSIQKCYYSEVGKKRTKYAGIGVAAAELEQGILYRLSKLVPKRFEDREEDQFVRDLCDKIADRFHAVISKEQMIQTIRDVVIHYRTYGRYYHWLIKKVNPKAIIVVCHFDSKLFPLYEVAHQCHVPVIELEHGLVSNHEAYNYKDVADEGKMLPDFFFMYGDFWKQYIQLPACMQPVIVGNPFLDSRRAKYKNIIPEEKSVVFYSGETGYDEAQFAVDFYKNNRKKGYQVYFKFHPTEYAVWEEKYPILKECPEIKIVPKEMDLYELLASVKHHVAVVSTVLFEAVTFDVKRYVMITQEWIQYIQPLIDSGLAKGFCTMEEFQSLLEKDRESYECDVDFMWKEGARENGLRALRQIIKGYGREA